jgi:penicillin-binding protein 2
MLEAGLATPTTLVGCPGQLHGRGRHVPQLEPGNEGPMNLATALKRSCDTYFYDLAFRQWQAEQRQEVPDEIMQRVSREFGLGARLGIDLPGEQAGSSRAASGARSSGCATATATASVPSARPGSLERELLLDLCRFGGIWRGGDAVNMSIGQGDVLTTPLQMLAAYQAIANDGVLLRPTVGRELRDADGELVRTIEPEVLSVSTCPAELRSDPARARARRDGARRHRRRCVRGFPLRDIPVAGKTGTAERKPRVPYAWFAAYAPADDPRYVVVVSVEEGGGGSQTAAPIARRILEHLFDVVAPTRRVRARPGDPRLMVRRAP